MMKESCRATHHEIPFQKIPKLLTTHIVLNMVNIINLFLKKGGISESLIPKTIMSGEILYFQKQLCIQMVQYCKVHKEESPRNSQDPRIKREICLGPSGNIQGGYKFVALNSGKKIVWKD